MSSKLSSALMEAVDEAQLAANPGKPFELLPCIRFILSKTGWILIIGIVCTLAALLFYQVVPPKYEATAKLYLLENDGSGVEMSALQAGTLLLSDYREVFKTWEVHEAVRTQLGLDMTYRDMQELLTVQIPSGSRLLYITIRHEDPLFAAELANTFARAGYDFIVGSLQGLEPDMFSSAIVPSHVSGLGLAMRLVIAFAIGMLLAACGCAALFCLDDRIRDAEELSLAANVPVLASIPYRRDPMMSIVEKEKACLLASQLLTRKASCVLVTAPQSGDGVSFVCDDLVQAMSALHRKALWIRVEHRPFWNHASGKTLGDYLKGECKWRALVQPYEGGSLLSICGTEDELPSQLFHPRMAALMEELQDAYDMILLDVPPVDQRADASAFFDFCNAVILVASCGRSSFSTVSAYAGALADSGCRLVGCVLNSTRGSSSKAVSHAQKVKEGAAA